MRNCYSSPKNGYGDRLISSSAHVSFCDILFLPKNGYGDRRINSWHYVNASIRQRFHIQPELETVPEPKPKTFDDIGEYLHGKKDIHSAIELCKELVDSGNDNAKKYLPELFFLLAQAYENGSIKYRIKKNLKTALEMFIKSYTHAFSYGLNFKAKAQENLSEMYFRLAQVYDSGDTEYGIEKDIVKANKYFDQALKLAA